MNRKIILPLHVVLLLYNNKGFSRFTNQFCTPILYWNLRRYVYMVPVQSKYKTTFVNYTWTGGDAVYNGSKILEQVFLFKELFY